MKKSLIIIFIFISFLNIAKSQNNWGVELSEGFVFFDYFGDEPRGHDKVFAGYGMQTEFDVWRNFYNIKNIDFKIGMGYTNYWYMYDYGFTFIAEDEISTSYLNLKLGVDYKPWHRVNFLLNSTHYFLLHKDKQQRSQNRWFTNLDLGVRIKLFKNFKLSLWSPITLYPLHNGERVTRPLSLLYSDFDPWVELTGLNLGISYEF